MVDCLLTAFNYRAHQPHQLTCLLTFDFDMKTAVFQRAVKCNNFPLLTMYFLYKKKNAALSDDLNSKDERPIWVQLW